MKAIILATENGEGLWPVPTGGTSLGASLLGRSLLEWNARALAEAGVTGLILALSEDAHVPVQDVLPAAVRRFPAGTGVTEILSACGEGLTKDFFLLSGGLLWRGDICPVAEAHRQGGFALTQVVFRGESQPLAGAGKKGRVLLFPPREGSALGLALCSPTVLPALAEAEDWPGLLALLRQTRALGAAEMEGRCDRVDSPAALLEAVVGLLSARRLPEVAPALRPGIWSASPIPEHVELVPPCSIGAGVTLGKGSLIGPHVVLEDGVSVGEHSLIQRSILQKGVSVGDRVTVYGAVVCEQAVLGSHTVLNEGAAIGPDARIGDSATLMEGMGVGPGERIPASARLTEDVRRWDAAPAWTVEDMLRLGRRLGKCGLVGTGGAGFQGLLLARAFGCGAAAQGAAVVLHDGVLPQQAAWLAGYYRWPASLFADEDGQVYLFDSKGEVLTAPPPDGEDGMGSWDLLAGTAAAYEAAMEREDAPARAAFRPCQEKEFL